MKKIRTIFSLLSLSLLAISCGLDNYDEPESFLEGKITYRPSSPSRIRENNSV